MGVSRRAVGAVVGTGRSQVGVRVSPATRKRIVATARRMHYSPNRSAQVMRAGRTHTIGVILHASLAQPAFERAYFTSKAVREAGYRFMVHDSILHEGACALAVARLIEARVEGVIVGSYTGDFGVRELDCLRRAGIPAVMLSAYRHSSIPFVACDARQGMREMTRHLLGLGYDRLVMMGPPVPEVLDPVRDWPAHDRRTGFREALEAAGGKVIGSKGINGAREVTVTGEWITGSLEGVSAFDPFEAGRRAMRDLLRRAELPDAVLCQNDDWAVGAIAACAEAGVRVPEDLAVTGFDNIAVGRMVTPPLTTVAQPSEAMAKKAVELLLKQMRGKTISTSDELVRLPCQLVVRQSCGAKAAQTWKPVEEADVPAGEACLANAAYIQRAVGP